MLTQEFILYIYSAFLTGVGDSVELYVTLGSTAEFNCPYKETTDAVIWRGPQQLSTYAVNNKINKNVPNSRRIKIDGNFAAGEYILKLLNFTKDDEGTYQCDTINNDKALKFKIEALIAEIPNLIDGKSEYLFYAKLKETINISFTVRSFETPMIKWVLPAGGNPGYGQINQINKTMFQAIFTLTAENAYQFGSYGLRIRNDAGDVFIKIHLLSSDVRIVKTDIHCNMWSSVNLTCQTTSDIALTFENIWVHTYNDVLIGKQAGQIKGNFSVLSLPFCVYQNTGNYSCKWFNSTEEYTARATVYVRSRPVCAEKKVQHVGDGLLLEVKFYSDPAPGLVFWYYKDNIITSVDKYQRHLKLATVQLTIQTKIVTTNGFVAILIIKNFTESDIAVYKCAIKNSLDVIDVHFTTKMITEAMLERNRTDIHQMTGKYINLVDPISN
ncbi:unnamed protein product [Mytilus coruscus]|uniref:Ig-like domain-containing protein n=1 Tax=Mytilus coruscus TaxID=42192 RepID=A0A6J8DY80_MYTCO|nr:unnamed protein product [Mytilus coruscus]